MPDFPDSTRPACRRENFDVERHITDPAQQAEGGESADGSDLAANNRTEMRLRLEKVSRGFLTPPAGAPDRQAPGAAELSSLLEGYEVTDILGRGAMGVVYRARQEGLEREVALKLLLNTRLAEGLAERFAREAKVTALLDHPSIVPVYEMGWDAAGRSFYTMRLVQGSELGEIFRLGRAGEKGWNIPRVVGVLLKVAQAVAFAHGKGVTHRDLKPSNVMVGNLG